MEGIKRHWWAAGTGALLFAYALLSTYFGNSPKAYILGDLTALILMSATTAAMVVNAKRFSGQARIFWFLMASGFLLWVINQALWTWFEVVLRKPLPDPAGEEKKRAPIEGIFPNAATAPAQQNQYQLSLTKARRLCSAGFLMSG